MSRTVAIALLGAAAAVGPLQACGTGPGREDVAIQRLDTRICETALECGCPPGFDDFGQPRTSECGGWEAGETDDSPSFTTSLAFDPSCVERWVEWLDERSCDATEPPSYADFCPLYHGTLREGEACDQGFFSLRHTECERGLYCLAGQCRDPQRTAFGTQGELCDLGDRCDGGLACFGTCLRVSGPGEPCLAGYLCNADAYCSDIACVARPGPGEPCDFTECRPDSFCSLDSSTGTSTCRLVGDVGDPCSGHRQCASANCPAGVCEPPAGVGAPCGSQLPCAPGLACIENRCQGAACTLLDAI